MHYQAYDFQLSDGTICTLQNAVVGDATQMLEYIWIVNEKTYFMPCYPEEITQLLSAGEAILKDFEQHRRKLLLTARINGSIAAVCGIEAQRNRIKTAHRAVFGISVKKQYWNCGIGSLLISEIICCAKKYSSEQLELGVFSDNTRAQHVYCKFGFEEWGRVPNAYKLKDGTYRDEITMRCFLR